MSLAPPPRAAAPRLPVAPIHRPRLGARGWVLAVLALLAAGAMMPSPLYSAYQQRLAFSDLTMTAVYAAYALVSVPALVFLGPLGDRLRPRLVLRAGVVVAAAGSTCLALATSLPWLIAGRAAHGVALGAVTGVGMALVSRLSGRRGAAATAGSVAFLLGSAAGPAITGVLAQYAPAPLLLPFAVHLALLATVFVGLRSVREDVPRGTQVSTSTSSSTEPTAPLPAGTRRVLLVAAANGFLGWTVTGMFLALVPSAVERTLGVRDLALAGGVAGAVLAWAAATPALLRHLGARRAQLVGLVAMVAPLLVLASGARSVVAMAAVCTVAGLAHGLLYGGAADLAGAVIPSERAGGLTATVYAAFYLGSGLPTLVAGLATTLLPLSTAVSMMAVVVLALCLAMLLPTRAVTTPPGPERSRASPSSRGAERTTSRARTRSPGNRVSCDADDSQRCRCGTVPGTRQPPTSIPTPGVNAARPRGVRSGKISSAAERVPRSGSRKDQAELTRK